MDLIILVFSIWAMCKGVKSLSRIKPKASRTTVTKPNNNSSMNTLLALQTQRDNIKNTIAELIALLDVSETAAETIRYKNMISTQYGKLATVESKISKLIY